MTTADEETKEMPVVITDDVHGSVHALKTEYAESKKASDKRLQEVKARFIESEAALIKAQLLHKDATPAAIASVFGGSVARMAVKIQTLQYNVKGLQESKAHLVEKAEGWKDRALMAEEKIKELEARIKTDLEG